MLKCVVIHRFIHSTLAPDFQKIIVSQAAALAPLAGRTAWFYINLSVLLSSLEMLITCLTVMQNLVLASINRI